MELPDIGKNCALKSCNRLDFLPVKCDACSEVFCIEHYRYDTHQCPKAKSKDVQVPACPLCSQPVIGKRDQLPDIAVSYHIDYLCSANNMMLDKKRTTRSSNLQACTFKLCKQKDLIYLECSECGSKFCIKHRHPSDHSCAGPSRSTYLADNWQSLKGSCSRRGSSSLDMIKNRAQQISKSGQAALSRLSNSRMTPTSSSANHTPPDSARSKRSLLQGNLTEEEALAIALRESANPANQNDNDEDIELVRAIQQSEIEARNNRGLSNGNSKDTCVVS